MNGLDVLVGLIALAAGLIILLVGWLLSREAEN